MTPLEEARKNTSVLLKDLIRVTVYSHLSEMSIGFEEITSELIDKVSSSYDKIMEEIEKQYLDHEILIPDETDYVKAEAYYTIFSINLMATIMGIGLGKKLK